LVGASSRAFIRQTSGGDAEIGAASGGLLSIFNNGSSALSFAAGGAATFSSSVTAGAFIKSSVTSGGSVITAESTATNGEGQFVVLGKNSSGTIRSGAFKYDNADVLRIGTSSNIGFQFETNDVARMFITSGGMVGIGMSGYSDMRLVVRGAATSSSTFGLRIEDSSANVTFQVRNDGFIETGTRSASPYNNSTSGRTMVIESSGGLGYTSSTRESKTNIEQLSDVSWLYQLNPVSFNYRKKDDEMKYTNEFNEEKWYGLIADEVESINEDLVFYNTKEDGTKHLAGVEYNKIIAALIKSSQEQQEQIEELKQLILNK
jgi:hypothetical protein